MDPIEGDWTPESVEEMARHEGIALGEQEWRAIASARELIARNGTAPSLDQINRSSGVPLAALKAMFPGNTEKILACLSGARDLERR
jgi:sulfur relay (sulfurtransferase) DsrC/TusE family protein